MDSGTDADVAALAVFGLFILPVLGWVVVRYMKHRERMEMIRHGMLPPQNMRGSDWRRMEAQGMPGFGAASGQAAGSGKRSCDDDFTDAAQRIVLRKGIRLTFIGMALTIGLSFIGYMTHDGGLLPQPGPWLLGGLIPMFIGLSQVASALLSGAAFGNAYRPGPPYGPPPIIDPPFSAPPPPFTAAPPTYDSSYTYRPGDTQELRPPTPPPERRG